MVVLSKAGAQVPVTPLLEVVGKADKVPPLQMAGTCVKVGVTGDGPVITNGIVTGVVQLPEPVTVMVWLPGK